MRRHILHPLFFLFLLSLISLTSKAQDSTLSEGKKVFVYQTSQNSMVKDFLTDAKKSLTEWGYWTIVDTKDSADLLLEIKVDSKHGITLTSWGGQTISMQAIFHDSQTSNAILWQSETVTRSPNGLNKFDAGKNALNRLIKDLKKSFK